MKKFINSILFFGCLFLLFSCEIGLGAAVDTEAPSVTIDSPQAGSVIRDSFAIRGSWSDDGAISSVKVTLESSDNLIDSITYDATISIDDDDAVSGSWYCVVDPDSEGIIDGEYKASVVITDNGGHSTSIPSYLLTVDNTAPLIVLQRPATTVGETADAYGQTFTLEGIGADDNSIDHIDIEIYSDENCTDLITTITKSSVAANIDLDLAEFEEGTDNTYSEIYGSTSLNGTEVRYCKLTAYDTAKAYPISGESSDEDELGNSTSTYYLYDDIYDEVIGNYNATTVYQMLSGYYLAYDSSRSESTVTAVKKALEKNVLEISKFSLNPENNPKFSVSGKDTLPDSDIDLSGDDYEITNGTEPVIEVSTGLDGISLDTSTLRPYVIPCTSAGVASVDDVEENRIYLAEAESGSKSGTSYKFDVSLTQGLTASNTDVVLDVDAEDPYYLFGVEGEDVRGNEVVANGNGYGFKFVSNGAAPDLSSIQTSTDGENWSTDSVIYLSAGSDLYIKGTVTVETGLATLNVYNNKSSNPDAIVTDSASLTEHTMYTDAVEGGTSTFQYQISSDNFGQDTTAQYAIRVEATKNKTSYSTVTVRYDVDGPVIKNYAISPKTTDSTGDTLALLNGTVTVSGLISDAYSGLSSENASWKVQTKDDLTDEDWVDSEDEGLSGSISDPSEFSFDVDTTLVEASADSVKYMRIVITAYDEAGNASEFKYAYTVDQSTDIPYVVETGTTLDTDLTYSELRENIATTVNKITKGTTVTFKVYDDDGFMDSTDSSSGLVITCTKNTTAGEGTDSFTADDSTTTTEYASISGNPTGPTITYDLPDVAGSYEIVLTLTDMYGSLSTATKTYTFYVQLTGNAPTVSMSTSPSYVTTNDESGLDSTYAETEYTVTLTITEGSPTYTAIRTNPDDTTETLTVDSTGTYPVITDTFAPRTTSDDSVVYTITDTYGKSKTLTFNYKIDNQVPSITIDGLTDTSLGSDNASYTFAGDADDTDDDDVTLSGLAEVQVSFDKSTIYTASGNSEWTYVARFSELGLTEGTNTLYARAVDNVGNISGWSSVSFIYDVSDPEASITQYTDVNSTEHTLSSTSFDYGYNFSLSGTAYDSNKVASVVLVQTNVGGADDGSDVVTSITSDLTVSNGEWTCINLPRASDGESFAAASSDDGETKATTGTYKYYLVVTDTAGKSTQTSTYTVTVDNTAPNLVLSAPSADLSGDDSLSGNSYTFKATSTDVSGGTGSQYIYYKFDSDSEYTQESIDDGVQWKLTKTLGTGTSGSDYDFYEGLHTIYVYSADSAGNESDIISRTFYVDQEAPEVTESAATTYVAYTSSDNGKVSLEGTITESYGIQSFTVSNGTTTYTLVSDGTIKTADNWTYTSTSSGASWTLYEYPGDGSYTYTVTATDLAGRSSSLTRSVIVDTSAPEISSISVKGTSIAPDADNSSVWYNSQTLTVLANVSDADTEGAGISTVEYLVLADDEEADSTSLADSEWTAMSLDSSSYKSSVYFDSLGSGQKLYIRASDYAGNVSYFNTDSSDTSLTEYARHVPVTINIDTSYPDLSALYYQVGSGSVKSASGTVYVNGSSVITLYGAYSDEESGIQELEFLLGSSSISPDLTYSTGSLEDSSITAANLAALTYEDYDSDDASSYTFWKAEFTPSADDFSSTENTSKKLYISGTNNASNTTSITPFSIVYDATSPSLSNLALATSSETYSVYQPSSSDLTYYVNYSDGTFTISGNSSDSSGIDTVKVEFYKANETSDAVLSETFSDTDAYVWSYSGIDLSGWSSAGGASAVITVTDNAGNTNSETMTLTFDTSAPTVSHGLDAKNKDLYLRVGTADNDDIDSDDDLWDDDLDTDVGGNYSASTYGNTLTMQIRGYFTDGTSGSGASKVYYYVTQTEPTETGDDLKALVLASPTGTISKLSTEQERRVFYNVTAGATDSYGGTLFSSGDSYDKYYKTISSNFYESLSGFAAGENFLVFVVTDNVGNSRLDTLSVDSTSYEFFYMNVDQTAPTITTDTTSILYSNGKTGNISLSGTVTDSEAGVDSLTISATCTSTTYTATIDDSGNWTASVPNSIFAGLTGSYTLTATAVDNAGTGNTSTLPVATILVDTTAPTVSLNALTDADTSVTGTQINGKISLSGTASDANGLKEESDTSTMYLYYTTSSTLGTVTTAPTSLTTDTDDSEDPDASEVWVQIASTTHGTSWTFDDVDTAILDGTNAIDDETTVYFTVAATDKAGNTGYAKPVAAKVDQDSDRPVIKYTNLTLGEMSSTTSLAMSTSYLYGSVTDDDGVSALYYQMADSDTALDDDEWEELELTNGAFTITFEDGAKKLYFKVVDTGETTDSDSGTTFISSASDEYSLATPKLTDSASTPNQYGYRDAEEGYLQTVTYIKVDTTAPFEGNLQFTTDTTSSSPSWSDKTDISSSPFGGSYKPAMKIRVPAWDANGISSVTLTIPDYTGTITFTDSKVNAGNATYTDATYWVSDAIDFTSMDSENKTCTLTVSDGVKTSSDTFTITVDNTAPVISVSAPDSSQYSSGTVTAYGETDLTDWKNTSSDSEPTEYMYYALSFDDETTPADDNSDDALAEVTAIENWLDEDDETGSTTISYKPYYTAILGGSFSWYVYFDGVASTTATHDVTLKQFLIDSGVTTQALIESTDSDRFETIVKAYLWIKAVDEVGNSSVVKHEILIDPQGDAPSVTLDYPESSGTTLGGSVTLRGTASDSYGTTIGVDSVWVQIISAIENGYVSSSVTSTSTQTCGGLSFEDTVTASTDDDGDTSYSHTYELSSFAPTMTDVSQWIENGYKVYTDVTSDSPTSVTSVTASSDSGADYYILATLSGSAWTLTINGSDEFNPDEGELNPIAYRVFAKDYDNNLSRYQEQLSVYDSDNPVISGLYLRQYDDDGEITASRAYEDDMWVKGTWYLCGTVTDTQGLSSLKVGPSASKTSQTITGTAGTAESFTYELSTSSGVGSLALVIEASDNASPVHTITKELVINYDNTAPELVTSGSNFNISSTVQNSNGFYSFGSQVTEDVVGSYSQSGFAYLAFWFERDITDKHVVYDVMRAKANSEVEYDGLTSDSGLMWNSVSVGRSSSSLGTLTLTTKDSNIHVGGLCKIAGSIYLITSVSDDGLTIVIDGQPEYTDPTETALFAIANVVDNNVESGSGTISTEDGSYGYYASISNDDGDYMVESVSKSGTCWTWEANINSQNMADGSVTLHYVAFDSAGNYAEGSVSGSVANNAPRLASLEVWSDFDEDGTKDDGEYETQYYQGKERKISGSYVTRASAVTSELVVSGNGYDYDDDTAGSAFMTVKATTRFTPELVGGNGALYYTYKYGSSSALASATTNIASDSIGSGSDDGIDEDVDDSGYYIQDQNALGYISGSTDSYMEIPGSEDDEEDGDYTLNMLGNSTSSTDPTWFEYTIYDSTEGCGTWSTTSLDSDNRLSATFRVALNVQYRDTTSPIVKIRPFYWNDADDNSVSWDDDGNAEGHIELEADLTDEIAALTDADGTTALGSDDPKVSGKIKIEGYAFDDIKLQYLYGIVSNHTNLSSATLLSTYSDGEWSSTDYSSDTGWGFEAEDEYCDGDGHLVHWTLTIDTSVRTSPAQLDQTVVVYAVDARGSDTTKTSAHDGTTQTTLTSYTWGSVSSEDDATSTYYTDIYGLTNASSSTSSTATVYKNTMTPYYKMDIVPYVSKVYTKLAKNKTTNWSVYNRTALGHYPVQSVVSNIDDSITLNTSTSEDVILYGFNLNDSSATITSGDYTFTVDNETDSLAIDNDTSGQLTFNVASLQTGELSLTVNGISILNNANDNDAAGSASDEGDDYENWYNRQANGDTNNILTDDLYFDVWEFNDRAALPINGLAAGINMEINQTTGMLNYAFANGGVYYSMGGAVSGTDYSSYYWTGDYDTFAGPCVGFHVDELGYTYSVDSGGDTNTSGSVDKWDLWTSRWGMGTHTYNGTLGNYNNLRMEEIGLRTGTDNLNYSLMKYRFLSPEFASTVSGTSTNLYLVYYDALCNQIRFRAGTFSGTSKQSTGGFQDEYTNGASSYYSTTNCQVIANADGSTFYTSATETKTIDGIDDRGAGQYVDVAAINDGTNDIVCVVWYDVEANACKYSYITDPIGNWSSLKGDVTAANWSTPQTIFSEGGEYCHIVADKNNHLHIAAYAGNSDVMYAYLDTYTSEASSCIVDASGSVGEHLTLDVAVNSKGNSIPYIGFYTGAIKKPKYAYLVDPTVEDSTATFTQVAAGADDNEQYTGAWEVVVVPTPSSMTTNREDKVNVGVWKSSGVLTNSKVNGAVQNSSIKNTVNAYNSTNWSKTYGNGTANGVLGYQISTSSGSCLETAQMR